VGTWVIVLADLIALGFFFQGRVQPWGVGNFLAMTALQIAVGVVCLIDGSVPNLAMGALDLALGIPYLLRVAVLRGDDWALPVLVIAVSILASLALGMRPSKNRSRIATSLRSIVTLYALVCIGIVTWSAANNAARHLQHPNRWLLGFLVTLVTVEWIFLPKRGEAGQEE